MLQSYLRLTEDCQEHLLLFWSKLCLWQNNWRQLCAIIISISSTFFVSSSFSFNLLKFLFAAKHFLAIYKIFECNFREVISCPIRQRLKFKSSIYLFYISIEFLGLALVPSGTHCHRANEYKIASDNAGPFIWLSWHNFTSIILWIHLSLALHLSTLPSPLRLAVAVRHPFEVDYYFSCFISIFLM